MTRLHPTRRTALNFGLGIIGSALMAGALARPVLAAAESAQDKADLARIATYFNGMRTLQGRFLQIASDGDAAEGKVWLRRPGRFRFEYDPPAPLLIVADGTYIVMEDRQLKSIERIPLGATPLDILVRDKVDFDDKSIRVTRIERGSAVLRVTLVDSSRPKDGALTLHFGDKPLELAGWAVLDAQGKLTTISLSKLDFNSDLPSSLFQPGGEATQMRDLQRRR